MCSCLYILLLNNCNALCVFTGSMKPYIAQAYGIPGKPEMLSPISSASSSLAWEGRYIGTSKLRLVEFSAYTDQQLETDSVSSHPHNLFYFKSSKSIHGIKCPARIHSNHVVDANIFHLVIFMQKSKLSSLKISKVFLLKLFIR